MHNTEAVAFNKLTLHKIAKMLLGVIALIAAANITIPLKPVPVSFQTIVIMVIGLAYSKEEALATVGTYLSLGALGVPVLLNFQGSLAYMMGPTAGYLVGFLLAVYIMAYLREKFDIAIWINCLVGHMLIYIPGVAWLSQLIGIEAAIYKGFIIYLPTGMFKIVILIGMLKLITKYRNY